MPRQRRRERPFAAIACREMVNPENEAPGSEPNLAAATEAVVAIRAEERIGVSFKRAGAGAYVAVLDLGDESC